MATFSVKITKGLDDLVEKLSKQLIDRKAIESLRRQVLPLVDREITKAVELVKGAFNPISVGGEDLAGQLGIGQGGNLDLERIRTAFILLVPGSSAAKISSSFSPRNLRNFGTIKFKINLERPLLL